MNGSCSSSCKPSSSDLCSSVTIYPPRVFPVRWLMSAKLVIASVNRMLKNTSDRYWKRRPAVTSTRSRIQSDNRYKKTAASVKKTMFISDLLLRPTNAPLIQILDPPWQRLHDLGQEEQVSRTVSARHGYGRTPGDRRRPGCRRSGRESRIDLDQGDSTRLRAAFMHEIRHE